MFLNYLAGAVSLVLVVSAFIPWVTVWFYSLKGIESIYGIGILVVGFLGVAVSVFQHLSGKTRGRAFIFLSFVAMVSEGGFLYKMISYGTQFNQVIQKLNDTLKLVREQNLLGDAVNQKIDQVFHWMKLGSRMLEVVGVRTSMNSFDFVGGGLVLAAICSAALLIIGVLLEKNKAITETE